jgi:hypothetical protein
MPQYNYSDHRDISIAPCDRYDPSAGYVIHIIDPMNGQTIYHSSIHPITGAKLDLKSCLAVAAMEVS